MSEERAKRLRDLKQRAESAKSASSSGSEAASTTLKFRNYRPGEEVQKQGDVEVLPTVRPAAHLADEGAGLGDGESGGHVEAAGDGTSILRRELDRVKANTDSSVLNIAPNKANWDLQRNVEGKLNKLNRRTQRALVEILREKLKREAEEASSDEEEDE